MSFQNNVWSWVFQRLGSMGISMQPFRLVFQLCFYFLWHIPVLQLFRRMHQKSSVDHETVPNFLLTWGWEDNDWINLLKMCVNFSFNFYMSSQQTRYNKLIIISCYNYSTCLLFGMDNEIIKVKQSKLHAWLRASDKHTARSIFFSMAGIKDGQHIVSENTLYKSILCISFV